MIYHGIQDQSLYVEFPTIPNVLSAAIDHDTQLQKLGTLIYPVTLKLGIVIYHGTQKLGIVISLESPASMHYTGFSINVINLKILSWRMLHCGVGFVEVDSVSCLFTAQNSRIQSPDFAWKFE